MSRPVRIMITRATKVPTKHQIVNMFRTDWKKVGTIGYEDSPRMFKVVDGFGLMESDAQFSKWLLDMFGPGIYFMRAWRKGYKGFWSFMKVEVTSEGYRRLPKNPTRAEYELMQEKRENKELKERYATISDPDEKEEVEADLEESDAFLDLSKEIAKDNRKRGCDPYLKSVKPLYSRHEYEDYMKTSSQSEVTTQRFF